MLKPSEYFGREQTYVKHFVLENYVERVAYNIYSFQNQFVYVDGFSGPWKSDNQSYDDTSFKIALDQLRKIRKTMRDRHSKNVNFRCMFIEKDRSAFDELQTAVNDIQDVEIELINGSFEDNVSKICGFVGQTFSLIFIDPTGWQGFPMQKISPLLNLRGEVLINFMSDFVNRFIEDPRSEIAATFDDLFGPDWFQEWEELRRYGFSREAAAIEVYTTRLRNAGNFNYVTSTRILKPQVDRSYFYLIYGTQYWKGIQEFRDVERKAINTQERVRNAAKYTLKITKTGQESLFGREIMDMRINPFEDEKQMQIERGVDKLDEILEKNPLGIKYEKLMGYVLEIPMIWESDLKKWILELVKQEKVTIIGLIGKQRVPRRGNTILPIRP